MLTLKEFDTLVFGFKLHSLFELSGNEGMALAKWVMHNGLSHHSQTGEVTTRPKKIYGLDLSFQGNSSTQHCSIESVVRSYNDLVNCITNMTWHLEYLWLVRSSLFSVWSKTETCDSWEFEPLFEKWVYREASKFKINLSWLPECEMCEKAPSFIITDSSQNMLNCNVSLQSNWNFWPTSDRYAKYIVLLT